MSATPPNGWARIFRRTQRRVNAALWADCFLSNVWKLLLVAALTLIYLRSVHLPIEFFYPALAGATAILAIACLYLIRHDLWAQRDAILRLETAQQWRSRLSAAAEGVSGWPDAPVADEMIDDGFRWNLRRAVAPAALASMLVVAAALFPAPAAGVTRSPAATAEIPA
jgi:hypothetical protein